MYLVLTLVLSRRTPPGVRELKHLNTLSIEAIGSRTPPGVRELKRACP